MFFGLVDEDCEVELFGCCGDFVGDFGEVGE